MATTENRRAYPPAVLILEPARSIIKRFGGAEKVAALTGRHVTRVRRWTYPREKSGSDGIIPMSEALKLVHGARENGIHDLTMDHFVFGASALDRNHLRVLAMLMDGQDLRKVAKAMKLKRAEVLAMEVTLRNSASVGPEVWELVEKRQAREAKAVA